ncbi:MAG: ribulose phosphate epimerase [Myxococcota bacterium]
MLSRATVLAVAACCGVLACNGDGESSVEFRDDLADDPDPALTFIQRPDVGDGTPQTCDQLIQDCPAGQKCMPHASDGGTWDSLRCVPVAPRPAAVSEPCTVEESTSSGLDDCVRGSMCWDPDPETNVGHCLPMARGDFNNLLCEDRFRTPTIANDGVLALCLPSCDPLLQDCAAGNHCVATGVEPGSEFACVPMVSVPKVGPGDPCEFLNSCSTGDVCLLAEFVPGCDVGFGCCVTVCDAAAPSCPAGQACTPWHTDGHAPPGQSDVGVCL